MKNYLRTFLAKNQLPSGGYESVSSIHKDIIQGKPRCTVFFPALILSALADDIHPNIESVKQNLTSFLLKNRSRGWTWNYWDREATEYSELPYPDDADDTFCTLGALYKMDPGLLDGKTLGTIVTALTQIESREGGPYKTWYSKDANWQDIDVAVNANIAHFLSMQSIDLPNLNKLIETSITQASLSSPYYPHNIPIAYFIAHWYRGPQSKKLADIILLSQKPNGSWGNAQDTACAVSSLMRLQPGTKHIKQAIAWLHSHKKACTKPYPFCLDPVDKGQKSYAGSGALTAALCLEALNMYQLHDMKSTSTPQPTKTSQIYKSIVASTKELLAHEPPKIKRIFNQTLSQLTEESSDTSIVLLPLMFNQSLKRTCNKALVMHLCKANLLGWIAYTLYDDVFDGDSTAEVIPVANICLRHVTQIYLTQTNQAFHQEFIRIMNIVDAANMWEMTHCRNIQSSPKYDPVELLANKSLGHALGPLTLIHSQGYSTDSREYRALLTFFIQYITARQLGDDAHDWEEDLQKEHISPVVAMLLQSVHKKNSQELRAHYWEKTILDVCEQIEYHINKAREALLDCTFLQSTEPFEQLLTKLTLMTQKTRKEREKSVEFMKGLSFR